MKNTISKVWLFSVISMGILILDQIIKNSGKNEYLL